MKLKKPIAIVVTIMMLATLVLACSGGGGNSKGNNNNSNNNEAKSPNTGNDNQNSDEIDFGGIIPGVKGELTTMIIMNQLNASDPELGAVYDYFKEYYPDLKLKQLDMVHEEYAPEKLTEAIAAGNTPDVFVTVPGDIPDLLSKQYIEPLDSYLDANPNYVKTLNPAVIDMNTYNGKTYGITWMTLPQTWMLNADLFEKMGVPLPTDDWTIDEFIDINKKLVDKANGISGSNPVIADTWGIFPFLEAYGVTGVKMVDGKPVSNFAEDPNAITAIEKWIEYTAKSNIPFTADEAAQFGLSDPWNAFWMKGNTGMVPWSLWGQPYNSDTQQNQFNWTVVRQPKGPEGKRGMISVGISMAIFPTSKNKDLAMKYIQIVTSKHFYENAMNKNKNTGELAPMTISPNGKTLPVGIPAINVDFVSAPENQAAVDGFVRSMQDAKLADYGGFGTLPLSEVVGRLQDVADGNISLPDALKQADEAINTKYYSTL